MRPNYTSNMYIQLKHIQPRKHIGHIHSYDVYKRTYLDISNNQTNFQVDHNLCTNPFKQ